MISIIVIFGIAVTTCLALVLLFGKRGVLLAGLVAGLAAAAFIYALQGFSNPLAILAYSTFWFVISLVVFYGVHIAKLLSQNKSIRSAETYVWGSVLVVGFIGIFGFQAYSRYTLNEIDVTFGFNGMPDFISDDVKIQFTKGAKTQAITFTSGGGSKKINSYGFRRYRDGKATLHYFPKAVKVTILEKHTVTIKLKKEFSHIVFSLNKNHDLTIYLDKKFEKTILAANWW